MQKDEKPPIEKREERVKLEAAYASCLTITARMTLDDLMIPYEGITVEVELERRDEGTVFHSYIAIARTLDEKAKQIVLKKS